MDTIGWFTRNFPGVYFTMFGKNGQRYKDKKQMGGKIGACSEGVLPRFTGFVFLTL